MLPTGLKTRNKYLGINDAAHIPTFSFTCLTPIYLYYYMSTLYLRHCATHRILIGPIHELKILLVREINKYPPSILACTSPLIDRNLAAVRLGSYLLEVRVYSHVRYI